MKRIIPIILIFAFLLTLFASCGGEDDTLKEIQEKNRKYQEFRQKFFESEGYKAANSYVVSLIKSVFDNNDYDVSIEPGKLTEEEFGNYDDFGNSDETKLAFFEKADLSVTMSCRDHNVDCEQMCKLFAESKITGRFYDPAFSLSYYYELDGRNGTFEKIPVPGV